MEMQNISEMPYQMQVLLDLQGHLLNKKTNLQEGYSVLKSIFTISSKRLMMEQPFLLIMNLD